MRQLTDRQEEILQYIIQCRDKNGAPPTIREIGHRFCIQEKGAWDHVSALEKKGYIKRREKKSRGIIILDDGKCAVHIGDGGTTMGLNRELAGKRLDGYYSLREAAEKLGVTKAWIQMLIKRGEIRPVYHVDGFYLLTDESIRSYTPPRKQYDTKKRSQ